MFQYLETVVEGVEQELVVLCDHSQNLPAVLPGILDTQSDIPGTDDSNGRMTVVSITPRAIFPPASQKIRWIDVAL